MNTTTKNLKFEKTFCIDSWANIYTTKTDNNEYKIYRERTFKNNETSKCDGNWIVQKNGQIEDSFSTLKEAKNYTNFIELF